VIAEYFIVWPPRFRRRFGLNRHRRAGNATGTTLNLRQAFTGFACIRSASAGILAAAR
jgi:hypothetical protein